MRKKWTVFLVALAILAVAVTACTKKGNTEKDGILIGLSLDSIVVERWQRELEILVATVDELGAHLDVQIANESIEKQTEQIKYLIDQEVDVLIIVPNDARAFYDVIAEADRNGIDVIAYDRLIMHPDVDLYVSFDNMEIGKGISQRLVDELIAKSEDALSDETLEGDAQSEAINGDSQNDEVINDEAQNGGSQNDNAQNGDAPIDANKTDDNGDQAPFNLLIINGDPKDNNSILLNKGFYETIQKHIESGFINVVDETWANEWREQYAKDLVEKQLASGVRIDGIIAANDVLATGAIEVLAKWRKAGEVIVVSQDAELSACQRIVEGTQLATAYKPIYDLASTTAKVAVGMAKGEKVFANDTIFNDFESIPYLKLDAYVVDKENMESVIIKSGFHRKEDIYRNTSNGK